MSWNTHGELLRPATIGKMELRNRVMMAPMDFKYFTGDSPQSTLPYRHAKVFEARAKGGCGLILTCAVQAEDEVMPYPYDMQFPLINRDERIKEFAEAADMVHVYGGKIGCELTMGSGRYYDTPVPGVDPIAPSACDTQYDPAIKARAMTKAEIRHMERTFAEGALRLKKAGFDCVLVMGQGGYLIEQFLSPAWNQRTDEYGGSVENRMRFLVETLEQTRELVGADFPLIQGLTMDENLPEGVGLAPGMRVEDTIEVARRLEATGLVDAFHLRVGNYYDQKEIVPSAYDDNHIYRESFPLFKAAVSLPCIYENKVGTAEEMERLVSSGEADFVSLGRMWITNPDLVSRVGHDQPLRTCLRCNYCLHTLWLGKGAKCAINPELGREWEGELAPAPRRKRVVVVGAGPGGVTAALVAARRGHDVTLLERGSAAGGRVDEVAAPAYKRHVLGYEAWLRHELGRSEVDVRYGVEATAETVEALEPDVAIVATGAEPIVPRRIPGVGRAVVADDVLRGRVRVSGTVAVIGAGLVGAELTSVLTDAGCRVHLVEMRDEPLKDASYVTRASELRILGQTGAEVHVRTRLSAITEEGIEADVLADDGSVLRRESIPCDWFVLAMGYRSTSTLADELRGSVEEVYEIGDARRCRKIANATEEGYVIARSL